jgi:NADH-quinone oxidoreductase subunit J
MISGMRLAWNLMASNLMAWNLMAWNLMAGTPDAAAAATEAGSATSAAGVLAGWTLVTAIVLGVVALILLLPATTGVRRLVGGLLALVSLSLVLTGLMLPLAPLSVQWIFWGLATVTLIGAVAAVVTRKPVYTALWFAMSLLGTAGLLLFDGAEFLSISTVAVYAGAILVTFLFVLMLAQPEGHASYDRITWGWYAKATAAAMAGLLVAMLTLGLSAAGSTWVSQADAATKRAVLDPAHLARFGGELFSKHLLSIEIAGAILLVALVGAIAIMLQTAEAASELERRARR